MAIHWIRPPGSQGPQLTMSEALTDRAAARLKLCESCLWFQAQPSRACRLITRGVDTPRPCPSDFERTLWSKARHPDSLCPWPIDNSPDAAV